MSQTKNKSFSLNKTNYIFLFIYMGIAFVMYLIFQDISGYSLGRVMGKMLGTMFVSIIAGYVFWLFSFKNEKIGAWGFNLMVVVIIGYMLMSYHKLHEANTAREELMLAEDEFYELMQSDPTDEQIDQAYKQYNEKIHNSLAKNAKHATGKNREVLLIADAYLREFDPLIKSWQASFDAFVEKDVLDTSMLKTDQYVFEKRIQIVEKLIFESQRYRDLIVNMEDTFRSRLLHLDLPQKTLDSAVKNFVHSPKVNLEELKLTMDALIDYVEDVSMILHLLNDNPDKWTHEGNELVIEDDDMFNQYNQAIDVLWEKETKVQELFAQVFNTPE